MDELQQVASWIDGAGVRGVVVLTGAGVSTESGIPDYRGPQGVWTREPEAEQLVTIGPYLSDPEVRRRSWQRRTDHPAWSAEPNAAHEAIATLESEGLVAGVVTQNIDGLHQRAGTDPDRVVEVHGSMREVVCVDCAWRAPTDVVVQRIDAGEADPRCPDCDGIVKTATIFFGEALDPTVIGRAQQLAEDCAVFIAVGTSLQVFPVALLPGVALAAGARLVIVNAEPTPYDAQADSVLRGQAGEILPALVELLVRG